MRLKDNHPVMKKIAKLSALAEELGITLSFDRCVIFSKDHLGTPFFLREVEDGRDATSFPPEIEFEVVFQKENF